MKLPNWKNCLNNSSRNVGWRTDGAFEKKNNSVSTARGETDMNRDRLAGICTQFRGRLREHWGRLSVDPLTTAAGTRDRLAGRVQERRGIAKEETDRELNDFLARNRNWSDLSRR